MEVSILHRKYTNTQYSLTTAYLSSYLIMVLQKFDWLITRDFNQPTVQVSFQNPLHCSCFPILFNIKWRISRDRKKLHLSNMHWMILQTVIFQSKGFLQHWMPKSRQSFFLCLPNRHCSIAAQWTDNSCSFCAFK